MSDTAISHAPRARSAVASVPFVIVGATFGSLTVVALWWDRLDSWVAVVYAAVSFVAFTTGSVLFPSSTRGDRVVTAGLVLLSGVMFAWSSAWAIHQPESASGQTCATADGPIPRGEPGYTAALDGDSDGMACE